MNSYFKTVSPYDIFSKDIIRLANTFAFIIDKYNELQIQGIKNDTNIPYHYISDFKNLTRSSLYDMIIDGNDITKRTENLTRLQRSIEPIVRYSRELKTKKTIANNQTKLIFIGNSRAGKTSLWQFLKDKIYNVQADSTHGIKTEIWDTETLGTKDNQNLAAHIWDFGGQEYYHATHRLFLADNAVYVLVWEQDSNKQGTRLEKFKLDDDPSGEIEEVDLEHFSASYWLENIQYFAGKHCPVLIVQNKVDDEAKKSPLY